ncbi:FKBP12-associated protein [Mortierella sp. AM989]|nr:FKBP12-associated protein [Mortierella sp. AM989]
MSDSNAPTTSASTSTSTSTRTDTGAASNAGTSKSSATTQGSASKKTAAKLNPDAKDYVPRSNTSGSADPNANSSTNNNPQAAGSNNNPRNRRRRNPDANNKSGNANNEANNKSSEAGSSNNNNHVNGGNNNNNNRNRRNRGRVPKQAIGGGARIDDDDYDDIEINMDRPVEPSESQPSATSGSGLESTLASGSTSTVTKDRRRDGGRKDKDMSNSSAPKHTQQGRGDKGRSRANGTDGQQESSSSSLCAPSTSNNNNNSGNNNRGDGSNSRRQRNRKTGDLGGRTFPAASPQGPSNQTRGESSGGQKNAQRKQQRGGQPKKSVHNVEEYRDQMATLTAGLTNSSYDCMVCWDVIRPAHKIWNCQVCWVAFHLDCLSTWAKKSSEVHVTLAHVPLVAVLVQFSHAIAAVNHFSCAVPLACGHHECTKTCHPLDDEPGQCPARPEVVETCPCGSKTIETLLLGRTRASCTDPIPVCGGLCKKPLNCGHRCMQKCHRGECSPCKMTVTVDCRCGSTRVQRVCSDMGQYGDDLPSCDRLCRGLRACGKHECTNRCCPGKNKIKGKKGDMAAMEAHICPLVCGKKLKCGIHNCEMLCHKGHCNPCLDASFDELSCACGRTVVYPPIPCGTSIPRCKYTCTRPRDCGHTSFSSHSCHPDNEPCPPCIMLVGKQCMCRKAKMPNVPCYKSNPSCGKICGKRLDCNLHNCNKSCHSGECSLLPLDICTQPCPKARKSCGHKCGVTCHGDAPCPEDQPCQVIVPSSCKCGNLTMESACNASAENIWDGKPRIIKCNDYCLIAERNKRIALALDIEEGSGQPGPRIPDYDPYVLDYALVNMEFTLKIEKQLAEWVADTTKPMLSLPPMKGHRRKFVHELAANYDVTSESVDVEPYRSVTIRRQLNTSVPDLLASQACRQKRPTGSSASGAATSVEQLRKPMIKDPVNAIYLHDLAFGLTRSELAARLAPVFGNIKYGIRWLTDDDAVLVPHPGSMQMDELEVVLVRLRTGIKAVTAKVNICERVELCWVNKEGEVVSHTNVGGGSQTKRFFSAAQGNQWSKKMEAPKVANAFALLDDDERIAAAKREEEERIFKAKEAAGTLSTDAWEEEAGTSSSSATAFAQYTMTSGSSLQGLSSVEAIPQPNASEVAEDLTKFIVVEAGEFTDEVVDDWQELLEDEEEEIEVETEARPEVGASIKSKSQESASEENTREQGSKKEPSSKGGSDDEGVLISQSDLIQTEAEQK